MSFIKYLRSPYPIASNKWKIIASVSLFVSLFILLFQPFGLQYMGSRYRTLILIGYGAVTFIIMVVNLIFIEAVFRRTFSEKKWTIGKQIVWLMWMLFSIGLGNYIYSVMVIPAIHKSFQSLLIFQGFTLAIGIFPVTLITVITHTVLLKINLQSALKLKENIYPESKAKDQGERALELTNENGKDRLKVFLDSLVFIESTGNYITIYWSENDKQEKKLLRNTLKDIGEQVSAFPNIFRCHRAYLVNLHKIEDVKGNAQGYQLRVSGSDSIIPVSRNYIPSFNQALGKNA